MWFAAALVIPIAVALGLSWYLTRARLPGSEAVREWRRFALLFVPTAIIIIVAAQLIWH
jgi:hypothetical protein